MTENLVVFAATALLLGLAAALLPFRAYVRAGGMQPRLALWLALAAPVAAGALYLAVGRPGVRDAPYADRMEAIERASLVDPLQLGPEQLLAVLADRARKDPDNAEPHYLRGLVLRELQRDAAAARAFREALKRDPANANAMYELADAMARMQNRLVTPDILRLAAAAAAQKPDDPRAFFYPALAASQEGRRADALRLWPEVLKRLPEKDGRRAMVEMMLADARRAP
jgi:cytochrome c-type biogenesis protein CcmH